MRSEQKHLTSCCQSILVEDCAVQCSEMDNYNKLAEFNPVHMLHLIKQLKDLVNKKDKRTCEIFTEMEQILQKIPVSFVKITLSGMLYLSVIFRYILFHIVIYFYRI